MVSEATQTLINVSVSTKTLYPQEALQCFWEGAPLSPHQIPPCFCCPREPPWLGSKTLASDYPLGLWRSILEYIQKTQWLRAATRAPDLRELHMHCEEFWWLALCYEKTNDLRSTHLFLITKVEVSLNMLLERWRNLYQVTQTNLILQRISIKQLSFLKTEKDF